MICTKVINIALQLFQYIGTFKVRNGLSSEARASAIKQHLAPLMVSCILQSICILFLSVYLSFDKYTPVYMGSLHLSVSHYTL
jgi:hypothetical protein